MCGEDDPSPIRRVLGARPTGQLALVAAVRLHREDHRPGGGKNAPDKCDSPIAVQGMPRRPWRVREAWRRSRQRSSRYLRVTCSHFSTCDRLLVTTLSTPLPQSIWLWPLRSTIRSRPDPPSTRESEPGPPWIESLPPKPCMKKSSPRPPWRRSSPVPPSSRRALCRLESSRPRACRRSGPHPAVRTDNPFAHTPRGHHCPGHRAKGRAAVYPRGHRSLGGLAVPHHSGGDTHAGIPPDGSG